MNKILLISAFFFLLGPLRAQQETDKLLEFYNILNFSYVDSFDFSKLSEKAIITMLAELDPHSLYIPADKVKEMNESLKGEYEGIGIQFDVYKDTILVVSVISGGPSDNAGLVSGDKIIRADGKDVSGVGLNDDEIISTLRGKNGSIVKLDVKKRHLPNLLSIDIKRGKIPIYSVDASYMINEQVGYIKINRFSRNTLSEFRKSIIQLKKEGAEDLILDLRNNGGGYLVSAVNLSDEFIKGRKEIVTTKGLRHPEHVYKANSKGLFQEGRLIVLINEGTASAQSLHTC